MDNIIAMQSSMVYYNGILGFGGYELDGLFCVFANGDNNFLLYGIAEGSLLVVDKKRGYECNKLNVFQTNVIADGIRQLKLSKTRIKGADYVGRVVISVNQYN